ncbi:laccase domain-containing protein [Lachnobacterium bovis]
MIYPSLNLSFYKSDEREKVLENYRRLAIALECNLDEFCFVFTDTYN